MTDYSKLDALSKAFYDDFSARGCSQASIEEFLIDYSVDEDFAFEELALANPGIDLLSETD